MCHGVHAKWGQEAVVGAAGQGDRSGIGRARGAAGAYVAERCAAHPMGARVQALSEDVANGEPAASRVPRSLRHSRKS
jgi:hypothetical protein